MGPWQDPNTTAEGDPRASVDFRGLHTLWFNTGTLCNIECANCYIESSPRNDQLSYLTLAEAITYLDEVEQLGWPTKEVGLTGGEPLMNPDCLAIIEEALKRGFRVLVLTNAMKPLANKLGNITGLAQQYGNRLTLRVSLDHYTQAVHEAERGTGSWTPALTGLLALQEAGISTAIAGRHLTDEDESAARMGYQRLFDAKGLLFNADDPACLTLFPEMDASQQATEITTACWDILSVRPEDQMCASSRMVVKRKGADSPTVLACTLLAYDPQFELGAGLAEATGPVKLNHPHCSQFCVMGGASCS